VTSGLTTLPLPEPAHRLLYSYKHLPNNISTFFQWRAQTAVFISVDSPRSRLIRAGTHLGREIWLERTRICVHLPLPMVGTSSTPGYCSKRWGVDPPKPGRCFAKEHEILYQHWLRFARVIIRDNGGVTPFGPLDCECENIRVRRLTPPEAVFQPWPPEPVVAVFQPQSESQ